MARQLDISIRTLSRAETGCGISKKILKKLCCLYQIPLAKLYDEKENIQDIASKHIDLIPENVAVVLLIKNSFISDLQQETICRYNDRIKRDALMCREEVEQFLPEIIGDKKMYSWTDLIGCCMAVNQKTIKNISEMNLM